MPARSKSGHPAGCRCRRCVDAWADDVLRAAGDRTRSLSSDAAEEGEDSGRRAVLPLDVATISRLALGDEEWAALHEWAAGEPPDGIRERVARRAARRRSIAEGERREAIRAALAPYVHADGDDPTAWTVREDRATDPLGGGAIRDRATGWAWVTEAQAAVATKRRARTVRKLVARGELPTRTAPDGTPLVAFDALDTPLELTEVLAGTAHRRTARRPARAAARTRRVRGLIDSAITATRARHSTHRGAAGHS